jgi:hypothetical protein
MLRDTDGVMDPANGTVSNALAYGMLPVSTIFDADGPGGADPVTTPVSSLFGVSSTLVTAVGALGPKLPPGATVSYVRRFYVGASAEVRAVADPIITELAARSSFATGTLSGNVDAADTPDVAASIVVTRLGACAGAPATACHAASDCAGTGPCNDPTPAAGFAPGGAVTQVRTDATGTFGAWSCRRAATRSACPRPERDDVAVGGITVGPGDTVVTIPPMTARSIVAFTVREKTKGRPTIPAKLVFKGADRHARSALPQGPVGDARRRRRPAGDLRWHAARRRRLGARAG